MRSYVERERMSNESVCWTGCASERSAKYPFNFEASVAHRGKIASDQRAAGLFSLRIRAQALGIANPHGIRSAIFIPFPAPLIKFANVYKGLDFEILGRVDRRPSPLVRPLPTLASFYFEIFIVRLRCSLTRAINSWIYWLSNNGESASLFPRVYRNYKMLDRRAGINRIASSSFVDNLKQSSD